MTKKPKRKCEAIYRVNGGGTLSKCDVCWYCRYFNIENEVCNIYNEKLKSAPSSYFKFYNASAPPASRIIKIEEYGSYQCSYWEERK